MVLVCVRVYVFDNKSKNKEPQWRDQQRPEGGPWGHHKFIHEKRSPKRRWQTKRFVSYRIVS